MKTIHILGLGSSTIDNMTVGTLNIIRQCEALYLRTEKHPCVQELQRMGVQYKTFDELYETLSSFDSVYDTIAATLLQCPFKTVVYAVPGAPMFYEDSVQRLLQKAPDDVDIVIESAVSFLDTVFSSLRLDGSKPFKVMDALEAESCLPDPDSINIFCQVCSRPAASRLKLALMRFYADDAAVVLVHQAGTENEHIEHLKLYEIDRSASISYLTTLIIAPQAQPSLTAGTFQTLLEITKTLRGEHGCAWDKKQTHESLRPYLLEEAYEAACAIDCKDEENLIEELGDVLLQVALHSEIAREMGTFTICDVLRSINEKMIRRHPHVFSPGQEHVTHDWEQLKRLEKEEQSCAKSTPLVPTGMPALMRAKKAAKLLGIQTQDKTHLHALLTQFLDKNEKESEDALCALLLEICALCATKGIEPENALDKFLNKHLTSQKHA